MRAKLNFYLAVLTGMTAATWCAMAFHGFLNEGAAVSPRPGTWYVNYGCAHVVTGALITNANTLPMTLTVSNWAADFTWTCPAVFILQAGQSTNLLATPFGIPVCSGMLESESDFTTIHWQCGDDSGDMPAQADYQRPNT